VTVAALQDSAADSLLQVLSTEQLRTLPQRLWAHVSSEAVVLGAIRILLIIAAAMIAYRVMKLLIGRLVRRTVDEEDPVVKRLREQRAQTVGGLLGNVTLIAVVTVTLLTLAGEFMDIGPLLASVGVLGLAVSFGAQSLVKDVISGTFMLMEGQFGVGDVVRVSDVAGAVEKITLRTTILRDIEGIVHIIPNGEITRVSNLTKQFSRAVLDMGVAYKEDVDHVMEVMRAVGRELETDPDFGPLLVDPPEVPGVQAFADSAVVIRMVAKTLPLKQWDVARELRRRLKKRFDAEGIEIPFPHMTFYWGEGQRPPAPSGH
jgi:small conductance mechanosensitive channel